MPAIVGSVAQTRGRSGKIAASFLLFAAVLIISTYITRSVSNQHASRIAGLVRREDGQNCHLVHSASDKCRFVRENCPDEEAGLFSYLQLYYCKLDHVHGVAFVILVLWLCLLFSTIGIAASDFFSINLSTMAALLGMSENLAGVTFLAFGNGSPDVFSTFAAMSTHSGSLAVGELIGAAGFITAVVSGSMAIVRPFEVSRASFVRDIIFFICAATLAMSFLLDGQLLLWECVLMVGFYLVYVFTVVAWHWVSGRRTARKAQEVAARQQFTTSESAQLGDTDVEPTVGARRSNSGNLSHLTPDEQFRLLERAGTDENEDYPDEETQWQAMSEISQNMRVNRSRMGTRRHTRNAIRPSLVGALEFRSVLSSLEKSRNQQAPPISLRRYSDDPGLRRFRPDQTSTQPGSREEANSQEHDRLSPNTENTNLNRGRNRAASANDVRAFSSRAVAQDDSESQLSPSIGYTRGGEPVVQTGVKLLGTAQTELLQPPDVAQRLNSVPSAQDTPHRGLAPPTTSGSPAGLQLNVPLSPEGPSPGIIRRSSSGLNDAGGTATSSPLMEFPAYHDNPNALERPSRTGTFRLPPPSLSIDLNASTSESFGGLPKHIAWWPYKILPAPQELFSTLFPTLYSWPQRKSWERVIGVFAAPSVFLLTITLPVVEEKPSDTESDDGLAQITEGSGPPGYIPVNNAPLISIEAPQEPDQSTLTGDDVSSGNAPVIETRAPLLHASQSSTLLDSDPSTAEWNRWLLCTQIIMAPLFVTLILWANTDSELSFRGLALAEIYSMLGALLVLAFILYTTSPERAPLYRPFFSFIGFIVSVAWISTIAGEVVGVLKALGVIFGISDAILGLTIFAVGNSLGDLVADITVAKLGYPVMALAACIGGPMLNILLGIGIGGIYMTIRDRDSVGNDEPFAPYQIQVGGTLIISSIALLITLVGLLIMVPMNNWVMDKKIGLSLIALWCVCTIVNVALEATGTVTSV